MITSKTWLEIKYSFRAAATDESEMSTNSLFLSTATMIIFFQINTIRTTTS